MKIIDLLNQISKKEKLPETIKFDGFDWKLYSEDDYYSEEYDGLLFKDYIEKKWYIVEILNEEIYVQKSIEKLKTYKEIDDEEHFANILKISKNGEYEIHEDLSVVIDKLNEVIDEINETKK